MQPAADLWMAPRLITILALAMTLMACSSEDSNNSGSDAGTDQGSTGGTDGGTTPVCPSGNEGTCETEGQECLFDVACLCGGSQEMTFECVDESWEQRDFDCGDGAGSDCPDMMTAD